MVIPKAGMFAVRIARNLARLSAEERARAMEQYNAEGKRLIEYAAKSLAQKSKRIIS